MQLDYKDIIIKHYALSMSGSKTARQTDFSKSGEYSNAIVHAFQRFRAPFSGKIVHIFPEQSTASN